MTSEGIYMDDRSLSDGYWCYMRYTQEDGYSTLFDPNSIYYARCEVKIDWLASGSFFAFGLFNGRHEGSLHYGIATNRVELARTTNGFEILSLRDKIKKHDDVVINGNTYKSDYPDVLQFGSAVAHQVNCLVKNIIIIDLTKIFGAGNEPPKFWCDANITVNSTSINWLKK